MILFSNLVEWAVSAFRWLWATSVPDDDETAAYGALEGAYVAFTEGTEHTYEEGQ